MKKHRVNKLWKSDIIELSKSNPGKKAPRWIYQKSLLELYLSGRWLTKLIKKCTNLEKLTIFNTKLNYLPPEIGNLIKLKELNIVACRLKELPCEIGNLVNLEILNISDNELTTLPKEISRLQNLKEINLQDRYQTSNPITKIPEEIFDLPFIVKQNIELETKEIYFFCPHNDRYNNTKSLELIDCIVSSRINKLKHLQCIKFRYVKYLPDEIGELENLRSIYIHSDTLKKLPSSIGKLKKLYELTLKCKLLTHLPPEIGDLENLKRLSLDSCEQLSHLPPEICKLKKLYHLGLENCKKITELPQKIGQLNNLGNYYVNTSKTSINQLPTSIRYWTELKILDGYEITSLPSAIGYLINLQELSLGVLTNLPPQFENLKNITKLRFGINHKSDCKQIFTILSKLDKLSSLSLYLAVNNNIPHEIGWLPNLSHLAISGNASYLPKSIGQLFNLKKLGIARIGLKTLPKEIGNLLALEELDLSYNSLLFLRTEIGLLENLKILNLDKNPIHGLSPKLFKKLNKLQEITLWNVAIPYYEFKQPHNYQYQDMSFGFRGYLKFKQLKHKYFSNNGLIKDIELFKISENNIEHIDLKNNISSGDHIYRVSYNKETDILLPEEIAQCKNLKRLYIGNTNSTSLPHIIAKLDKIEYIDIRDTKITKNLINLKKLTNLKKIAINKKAFIKLAISFEIILLLKAPKYNIIIALLILFLVLVLFYYM